MSAQHYTRQTRRGDRVGITFAPTLGRFRGEAWGPWGHGVCSHEHDTPEAAERCARSMAVRIRRAEGLAA